MSNENTAPVGELTYGQIEHHWLADCEMRNGNPGWLEFARAVIAADRALRASPAAVEAIAETSRPFTGKFHGETDRDRDERISKFYEDERSEAGSHKPQQIAEPAVVGQAGREFTDGTRTLHQDCISAVRDFANTRPEEDETWESWFEAAFDLCGSRLGRIFDEHAAAQQIAEPTPPLSAPVTDDEIDAAFDALGLIRESTTVGEVRRVLEGFAAGRAAGVEDEPVAQWQKKHPYRTDGRWQNTDEHDARWWVTNSMGWEMRALYVAPQPPAALEPGWISVDERLPEIGRTPVLVAVEWRKYHENEDGSPAYSEGIDVTEGEYVPGFCDRAGYMESFQGKHGDSSAVTHWMPLPPPPATL